MPSLAEALANRKDSRYGLKAEKLLDTLDAETSETLREALHNPEIGPVTLSKAIAEATDETLSVTAITSYRDRYRVERS